MNQEEIEIMNNPITNTENETVIKKISPKTKAQGQMASHGNSIKHSEEQVPIFLKLFQKIAVEGTLPNSFYKATITLIPKPGKDNRKKENYRAIFNISDEHRCKNPQQNSSKQNPTTH